MSAQTTLTENAPVIVDPTCSFAKTRGWSRHATIHMDNRREVKPDIVADARFMPIKSKSAKIVKLDPPHLFRSNGQLDFVQRYRRKSGRMSPGQFERYGFWRSRAEWLSFAQAATMEAVRILQNGGTIEYKLTETKDYRLKIADLPLDRFDYIDKQKPSRSNLPSKCMTHYLTMKPKAQAVA